MHPTNPYVWIWSAVLLCPAATEGRGAEAWPTEYPGTGALTWTDDVASRMVAGVDRFLLRELDSSVAGRAAFWQRDLRSAEAYAASLDPQRRRLAHILGVRDPRVEFAGLTLEATTSAPGVLVALPIAPLVLARQRIR